MSDNYSSNIYFNTSLNDVDDSVFFIPNQTQRGGAKVYIQSNNFVMLKEDEDNR